MEQKKKLNLNKYAYLDYLKGDVFAWLNCNENFQKASKEDEILRAATPWRYDGGDDEEEEWDSERYDIPDQIKEGLSVGYYSELWAKETYPNHKVITINKQTNLENIEQTKSALETNEDLIIFEATFSYNDFVTRTDILIKTGNEVKVIEVKAVTYPKVIHALDIFFQKTLIEKSNPSFYHWDYSLLIVNNEFINNQSYTDEQKAKMALVNVDYIGSGKSKPKGKKEINGVKYDMTWSISTNKHFFRELNYEEKAIISFDPESPSLPRPAITFPIEDLFETEYINKLSNSFDETLERIKQIQLMDAPPKFEFALKNNNYMKSDYLNWILNREGAFDSGVDSVFNVSRLTFDKKIELFQDGKVSIKDIDNSYLVPQKFNIQNEKTTFNEVLDFMKTSPGEKGISAYGKLIQKHYADIDEELIHRDGIEDALDDYKVGPIYMYDFETANLAIPLTDGARPYEQVVYQYSIHIITDPNDFDFQTGKNIIHREWLAEDRNEFSTEVWKEFVNVFKEFGKGKYVAWNMPFEKGCLSRAQTDKLDDNEIELLNEIREETIDLMIPFYNKYYYHKNFHGSYSIKAVGPHFAKEINYKNLNNVQRGDQSAAKAKAWLRNNTPEGEQDWIEIRKDMLKYCEYDTLLMVAILQRLKEKVND